MWVIATEEEHYWNRDDHCWVVGIGNATKYTEVERNETPYPKLSSEYGGISWSEVD